MHQMKAKAVVLACLLLHAAMASGVDAQYSEPRDRELLLVRVSGKTALSTATGKS